MKDRYFVLDGKEVVPVDDVLTWARWFEQHPDRRVAQTTIGGDILVSTVFLGLNHAWSPGPPLLFETMVFNLPEADDITARYSTWAEAEAGHQAAVAVVRDILRGIDDSLRPAPPA